MSDMTTPEEQAPETAPVQAEAQEAPAASSAAETPVAVEPVVATPISETVTNDAAAPESPVVESTASEPVAAEPAAPAAAPVAADAAATPADSAPQEAAPAQTSVDPAVAAAAAIATAEEQRRRAEEKARKEEERRLRDLAYSKLEGVKAENGTIEVTFQERVKGGLRGEYESLRVFLPASHIGLKKGATDEELNGMVGQTLTVRIHELQSDETGYKSAVVSRRDIVLDELWSNISAGDVVEGVVTTLLPYGVFVNIGGLEGLVHISRLSKVRLDDVKSAVKKGDRIKVTVVEIDRSKRKITLSHREHETDPWEKITKKFEVGKVLRGTVRRITDFGAYVQVAPRIDGLLRISELSWTRRLAHPSEVVTVGQEIDVVVLSFQPEKHQLTLGYRQTQPNPWLTIGETFGAGTELTGVVISTSPQGAVVRINDVFDGFMPRSRFLSEGRGKKVNIEQGQSVNLVVLEVKPESQSIILAMKGEDGTIGGADDRFEGRGERGERGGRGGRGDRRDNRDERPTGPIPPQTTTGGDVALGDLLKDIDKSKMFNG
ncbi:MAG TPA: S1 RNA-binding domain-containing protein [Chlorobiota bacterium]|nr:S1 RNA-binding domain-containing protein [Chlorobiota bacterium]